MGGGLIIQTNLIYWYGTAIMLPDIGKPIPDVNSITIAVERAGINFVSKLAFNVISKTLKRLRNTVSQCKMRWYKIEPALNDPPHTVQSAAERTAVI